MTKQFGFERWSAFCNEHGDRTEQEEGFYASNADAPGASKDYLLCEKDARRASCALRCTWRSSG